MTGVHFCRMATTMLSCAPCRVRYSVADYNPSRKYACRKCGGALKRADEAATVRDHELRMTKGDPVEEDPEEIRQAAADPRKRVGKYVLLSELGRGGMGVVYKSWDSGLKRWVALKLLTTPGSREDVLRFHREAQTAAALRHPNIVGVYEVGEAAGHPFIALEYVEGKTLSGQKLPVRRAAEVVAQIARAVEYAHGQGVIHRDLKPGNVMIDKAGKAWVMDFGLAKNVRGESQLTMSGTVIGTPSYMPPEQASGRNRELDRRVDVYSLGAVLYELATGRAPFRGSSPLATLEQVVNQEVRPPSELNSAVPPDLETILLKCLEKDRHRRYPSVRLLADDLERWLRGDSIAARRASLLVKMSGRLARHRSAVAAIGAIIVALSGITATILFVRRKKPLPPIQAREVAPPPTEDAQPHFDAGRSKLAEAVADQYRRGADLSRTERLLREAIEHYSTALTLRPDYPEALFDRGRANVLLGDHDAAESDFSSAIRLQQAYSDALYERGRLYVERSMVASGRALRLPSQGRESDAWRAKARADLAEFRRLAGGRSEIAQYASALLAFSENRTDDALVLCDTLVSAGARNELVYKLQGDILVHLSKWTGGQLAAAELAYDRAIERRPNYYEALLLRGNVRLRRGRPKEALEDYTQAIAIHDRRSDAFTNRGAIRKESGDRKGAREDWERAARLDPRDADSRNNLGVLALEDKNFDAALRLFEEAFRLDPSSLTALTNRAAAKRFLNDFDGALRDYAEAIRLDPKFPNPYFNRGILHLHRKEWASAVTDFTEFLARYPTRDSVLENAHFSRAMAYSGLARYRDAIADWKKCLELDSPRRQEIERYIAEAERRLGD